MVDAPEEEARRIAEGHYELEPGIRVIYRIEQAPGPALLPPGRIRLLEVNENTIPVGIIPLQFPPWPEGGSQYPSIIVEVTPDEFDRIRSGQLRLPPGWACGESIPRSRESVSG